MTAIKSPGSVFSFASGISFTLASLFSDILLIRVFLLFAYLFLLITGALGMPAWPGVEPVDPHQVGLETVIFSSINIVTHSLAILRLLYDERKINFEGEDEHAELLWRFLYRRGGFERLEASEVMRRGAFRTIVEGGTVLGEDEAAEKICILMKGKVSYRRRQLAGANEIDGHAGKATSDVTGTLLSGSIFDIRLLSILGVYTGFDDADTIKSFSATACTDCLVFDLPLVKLDELSTSCGPAVSSYFRNFVLCDLALQLEYRVDGQSHARSSDGSLEKDGWQDGAMSRDFTDTLDEPKLNANERIKAFFVWLYESFSWLVPSGVRHVGLRGLPRTGLAAKRRLRAISEAKTRADLVRQRRAGLFPRISSRFSRK